MNNIFGIFLISMGLLLDLIGCLGLIRLPDVYNRLQASTKCVVGGTCLILVGCVMIVGFSASGIKMMLCLSFLLLVVPVTAHALSRAALRTGVPLGAGSLVDHYNADKKGGGTGEIAEG